MLMKLLEFPFLILRNIPSLRQMRGITTTNERNNIVMKEMLNGLKETTFKIPVVNI